MSSCVDCESLTHGYNGLLDSMDRGGTDRLESCQGDVPPFGLVGKVW